MGSQWAYCIARTFRRDAESAERGAFHRSRTNDRGGHAPRSAAQSLRLAAKRWDGIGVRWEKSREPAMSALRKTKLTVAEYLTIEQKAETKSEFFNGEMFAMAGASRFHNFVKTNLESELMARLKGSRCRTASGDLRVMIPATGLYTYPDIVIFCGPGEYDPEDEDTLVNPTAVIEITSPSTEKYDRGAKMRNYQRIASLREYVLVAQDEPVCERFVRQADGTWALMSFVGLSAELAFASVPARIPLADVYAGVTFPEPTPTV